VAPGTATPPAGAGLLDGDALPLLPEERQRAAPLAPRRLHRSFGAAFAGLGHLLRHEPNAQIHAALAAVATVLGLWLGLTPPEWALLMALFGLVIGLEAMNTAVEGLADLAMPRRDPRVATMKDLAAGGVLAAALAAAAAGLFLFGPRLWRLLGG
jgi:diacylglycerol kinase